MGYALIDDVHADFCETIYVSFTSAEVAAFDRVIEETMNGVSIILVVLRGIDPALSRNGVGTSRAVLEAEALHLIAKFREGCS